MPASFFACASYAAPSLHVSARIEHLDGELRELSVGHPKSEHRVGAEFGAIELAGERRVRTIARV